MGFANAFWIVGRNQLEYDEIEVSEDADPPPLYADSFLGAFKFMYYMCLGEVGT